MTDQSSNRSSDELDLFGGNLDRWGADLSRWPATEAAAAESLLQRSEAAKRELARALELDSMLTSLPQVSLPPALHRKLATPPENRSDDTLARLLDWFAISLWRPILSATLVLVIGFTFGFLQADDLLEAQAEQTSLLAFSTVFEDYNEEYSDDVQ